MDQQNFEQLSTNLQSIVKIIPLKWGNIQNNDWDSKLNLFEINDYQTLEKNISDFDEAIKNYFRRRWFIWKCAQCDEHIFCENLNVIANPNAKAQDYDIEFNGNQQSRFDIKGTVIPKQFRANIEQLLNDSQPLVDFFYEQQSRGVRKNIQNRLFIIHHSYINQEREMYLRCHWAYKTKVYKEYSSYINAKTKFAHYDDVKADIIFIFENMDRSITHNFLSMRNFE
jgi:hypothetical protein